MADWAMLYCIKYGEKSEGTRKKRLAYKKCDKTKLGAENL